MSKELYLACPSDHWPLFRARLDHPTVPNTDPFVGSRSSEDERTVFVPVNAEDLTAGGRDKERWGGNRGGEGSRGTG